MSYGRTSKTVAEVLREQEEIYPDMPRNPLTIEGFSEELLHLADEMEYGYITPQQFAERCLTRAIYRLQGMVAYGEDWEHWTGKE